MIYQNSSRFLLFSFLLVPLLLSGQSKYNSGVVTYGVDLDFKPSEEVKTANKLGHQYLEKMMAQAKESASGITCTLKFDSNTAYFFTEDGLEKETGSGHKMALLHLDIDGPYYVDLKNKEILQEKEAFGKNYLVEEDFSIKFKWSISSESKKIGNYKVYKATTVEVVENSKGTFESEVIAWFAPDIPFGFGPIGYGGLPGLILELKVESNFQAHYFVTTIEFGREASSVEIPSNRKRISPEELDGMYKKAMGNMRDF